MEDLEKNLDNYGKRADSIIVCGSLGVLKNDISDIIARTSNDSDIVISTGLRSPFHDFLVRKFTQINEQHDILIFHPHELNWSNNSLPRLTQNRPCSIDRRRYSTHSLNRLANTIKQSDRDFDDFKGDLNKPPEN